MKTLNDKLQLAINNSRGLVKNSLIQLSRTGITRTGKNQNKKNRVWTKDVCSVLQASKIPFISGNDAPRGGVTGEYVRLTSKSQLYQINVEQDRIKRETAMDERIAEQELTQSEIQIVEFIKNNQEMITEKISELDNLRAIGDKENWHIKANALVQTVCNNDFRIGWKKIYELIKTVK